MFRKKLPLMAFLLTLLMFFTVQPILAQTYGVTVYVDSKKIAFPDQEPFIDSNNRTLVPIRFIAEEMGATVEWRADSRMVIIEYDKGEVEKSTIDKIKDFFSLQNLMKQLKYLVNRTLIGLQIGESKALVNGEWKTFDTKPVIVNGRTMVPLRFISETMGAKVDWDGATRTVNIWTTGGGKGELSPKTTALTEADIQRLRSYPIERKMNDYMFFDNLLKLNDGYDANFAVNETTQILNSNRYRGGEYYPGAEYVRFYTDPRTVYRDFRGYYAVRGVLQIKYKGSNPEGLEPGKLYERDMEYCGRLNALDSQTIGWRIDFAIPLSNWKEVKE